jgi:hypothetical protein
MTALHWRPSNGQKCFIPLSRTCQVCYIPTLIFARQEKNRRQAWPNRAQPNTSPGLQAQYLPIAAGMVRLARIPLRWRGAAAADLSPSPSPAPPPLALQPARWRDVDLPRPRPLLQYSRPWGGHGRRDILVARP